MAKGIRRITGITGPAALAAKQTAVMLQSDIQKVLSEIKSNKNSDLTSLSGIEERIIGLRSRLDESVVSVAMKFNSRGQLEAGQKETLALKNKLMMSKVDESIKLVKQEALDALTR